MNSKALALGVRRFSDADQSWFAQLSGDFNPWHLDPISARRTQAGLPVVHGVHSLLWLLESLRGSNPALGPVAAIKVKFTRLVHEGEEAEAVVLHTSEKQLRAEIRVAGVTAVQLSIGFGNVNNADIHATFVPVGGARWNRPLKPVELEMSQAENLDGTIEFPSSAEAFETAFPSVAGWIGARRLAALACTSLMVGMIAPGLHSIFVGLSIQLCEEAEPFSGISFAVTSTEPRYRWIKTKIYGGGVFGEVDAVMRQPPVQQPSIDTVAKRVNREEFSGTTVLVIGASRGLGELTAKIIAVGGGNVIATYSVGKTDAERLASEICGWGGACRAFRFDILKDAGSQLEALGVKPTHMYYFATPAIFTGRARLFSESTFSKMSEYYLYGFYRLLEACLQLSAEGLSVFYPSSVAVEARPENLTEYAMVKAAGEILCAELGNRLKGLRIHSKRLPRLATDQTASPLEIEMANSLDVMLPIVREVQLNR